MKKLLFLLTALALLMCAVISSFSEEEKDTSVLSNDFFTYEHVDSGITIFGINAGNEDTIIIPSHVDGYPVKEVRIHHMHDNETLRHLILSEGIETLTFGYSYPSYGNLTDITLPATLLNLNTYNDSFSALDGIALLPGPNGTRYEHIDGVLFDNLTKTLLHYSAIKTENTYTLPNGTLKIAENAFQNQNLTSIVLNEELREIEPYAFYNLDHLKKINLPASLESIGFAPFQAGCAIDISISGNRFAVYDHCLYDMVNCVLIVCIDNVQSITIHPSTVKIGHLAFYACTEIEKVEMASACLTEIGESAFVKCEKLSSFRFPESLTKIGNSAFYECASLFSAVIPGGVKKIPLRAFAGCTKLTTVVLEEGIEIMGEEAFHLCKSLLSVKAPQSLRRIEKNAYFGCSMLVSVFLPKNFEFIGAGAFENCVLLGTLTTGDGLTVISENAFRGCENLKFLFLNNRLETIGEGAFALCNQLEIRANGDQPYYSVLDGALYDKRTKTLIHYFSGTEGAHLSIPSGILSIAASAFEGNTTISSVSFPKTLETIGESTFCNASALEKVVFSGPVKKIGEYSFYGTKLTDLLLPEGLTDIGRSAFAENRSLTSIHIPGSVKRIGYDAFEGCTSLASVIIEQGCEFIGAWAFDGCSSLKSLYLPASITEIDGSINGELDRMNPFGLTLIVERHSYALEYAREYNYCYLYPDSYDWLKK